jgi:phage/plasmid-associated DNA primase
VRFAVFNEPSGKDVINEGILKELSGNDSIYVRGLFKEPEEIKPMFKLALISNKLPKLPASDTGVWSRIRVLPHLALFPKDQTLVPKTIEEQYRQKIFPRDPLFNEKLPRFKSAMMWLMVQKWYKIDAFGREEEPELVKSATAEYRKNNDIFLQFIMERLIRDPYNEKAQLSVVELYNAFKTWFTDSYPNLMNQMPSKEELKEDFVNKWGELSQNHKWKGYRIRTLEDDEREGAVLVLRENDLASSKEEDEDFKEHEESKVEEDTEDSDSDSDSEEDSDSDSDSEAEEDEDDNIIIRKK